MEHLNDLKLNRPFGDNYVVVNPPTVNYGKETSTLLQRVLKKVDDNVVDMLKPSVSFGQCKDGLLKMTYAVLWNGRNTSQDTFVLQAVRIAELVQNGEAIANKQLRSIYSILWIANELVSPK